MAWSGPSHLISGCRHRWPLAQLRHDLSDYVRRVFRNAADQRGSRPILVTHADERQARPVDGHSALVVRIAVEPERRQLDPRIVGPEARAPDDGRDAADD